MREGANVLVALVAGAERPWKGQGPAVGWDDRAAVVWQIALSLLPGNIRSGVEAVVALKLGHQQVGSPLGAGQSAPTLLWEYARGDSRVT
jgi:hypothetical protein